MKCLCHISKKACHLHRGAVHVHPTPVPEVVAEGHVAQADDEVGTPPLPASESFPVAPPPTDALEGPQEIEGEELQTFLVSPSELGYMFDCHTKHHYAYDLRYTSIDRNEGMDRGDMIHEALKGYYREKIRQIQAKIPREERDFAGMQKAAVKAMGPAIARVNLDGDNISFLHTTVEDYTKWYKGEGLDPIAAEQWFNKELFVHDGVRYCIYGKIDLIAKNRENGRITIIDHKSGNKTYEPSEMDIQYKTYCLGTGIRDVMWNFVGLQSSYKFPKRIERRIWSYTEIQMEEFKQELIFKILEHVRNTKIGHYPMNPMACIVGYRKCYFYDVCKGDPRVRERRLNNFFIRKGLDKSLDKLREEYEEHHRGQTTDPSA